MTNRLNGWQRIGVVITGLWLLFVALLGVLSAFDTGPFGEKIQGAYETVRTEAVCSKPAPPMAPGQKTFSFEEAFGCTTGAMISPPSEKAVQVTPDRQDFFWGAFLVALLIPPVLFWLLSYGSVAVFKWVAQGFRRGAA